MFLLFLVEQKFLKKKRVDTSFLKSIRYEKSLSQPKQSQKKDKTQFQSKKYDSFITICSFKTTIKFISNEMNFCDKDKKQWNQLYPMKNIRRECSIIYFIPARALIFWV